MATQDYSNASAILRNTASRGIVDTTARPIDFIRLLQARGRFIPVTSLPRPGAEPYVVSLVTGNGSTAGRFAEGQAASSGSRRSFANASFSAFYWREVVRATGRNLDIARAGGFVEANQLQAEIENATMNLMYAMEGDFLGSTVNLGIASIIDDTTLLGGLDPATYTTHASKVSTVSGAQTAAALADHYEAITSSPYLAMPSDILSCPGQVTNYTNLAGLGGGTNVSRMMLPLAQGYDIGVNPAAASFNGIPWRQINGMTTTETYWPNLADYTMGVQRDVTYEPYGKTNDDTTGQVTMAVIPILERRRSHSKQESLTA